MSVGVIGVSAQGRDAPAMLARIELLEKNGISAAWLATNIAVGVDALSIFAAAAVRTEHILLGTSIIPTWPRHL